MNKLLFVMLLVSILMVLPTAAFAKQSQLSFIQLENQGWVCDEIGGEQHCFDPGDMKSKNMATLNVLVFDSNEDFAGSEILWLAEADIYAGQPCPQDDPLDLGFAIACHQYSH